MPKFEFIGPDPIDHFDLGRVSPGDVRELDRAPVGPWREVKPRPRPSPRTEHGSDAPIASEED